MNLSIIGSILLTFGILSNPTISFSQQEPSSVIITLGAADEGNFEPFTPRAVNVMQGSIVSWTNEDSTPHTVTAEGMVPYLTQVKYPQETHLRIYLICQENLVIIVQSIHG